MQLPLPPPPLWGCFNEWRNDDHSTIGTNHTAGSDHSYSNRSIAVPMLKGWWEVTAKILLDHNWNWFSILEVISFKVGSGRALKAVCMNNTFLILNKKEKRKKKKRERRKKERKSSTSYVSTYPKCKPLISM